jgi:hypothetical protein
MDNIIDIYDMLELKHIRKGFGGYTLSGHCHRNSTFETSNSCGNCDGACCDYCEKIPNDEIEVSIPSDELEQMLISKGCPEDVASDFAYNDFVRNHCRGYYFYFPTESGLKMNRPDLVEAFYKAN